MQTTGNTTEKRGVPPGSTPRRENPPPCPRQFLPALLLAGYVLHRIREDGAAPLPGERRN